MTRQVRERERRSTGQSVLIPSIGFGLALMGVVPTLFAIRGILPSLVALILCVLIGITTYLADRAHRAKRLDRPFAVSAMLLVFFLVLTVFWLSQHRLGNRPVISADIPYRVDPTLESPQPVPGVSLKPGDIVHVDRTSGMWGCGRFGEMNLGLAGMKNPPGDPASFLVPLAPLCSLVVRVGEGKWMFLGDEKLFPVVSSGSLYLTANDVVSGRCNPEENYDMGCYADNTGGINISIRVDRRTS